MFMKVKHLCHHRVFWRWVTRKRLSWKRESKKFVLAFVVVWAKLLEVFSLTFTGRRVRRQLLTRGRSRRTKGRDWSNSKIVTQTLLPTLVCSFIHYSFINDKIVPFQLISPKPIRHSSGIIPQNTHSLPLSRPLSTFLQTTSLAS